MGKKFRNFLFKANLKWKNELLTAYYYGIINF